MERVLLIALQKINRERTVNAIYHLLTGKRSIQTIQDAHLFELDAFFGIEPRLSFEDFHQNVTNLIRTNKVTKVKKDTFLLTEEGYKSINNPFSYPFYFKGIEYASYDREWMRRLTLMIQVWTNQNKQIKRYIPIVDQPATIRWVKAFYRTLKKGTDEYIKTLYDELIKLLEPLPDSYVQMFIKQLTTPVQIGLTKEQLATLFHMSPVDIQLHKTNYIHYMLGVINRNKKTYPLLYTFGQDLFEKHPSQTITNSAQITKRFVEQGLTPEQIANKRRLKTSTIHDHLVEISLQDPSFPLDRFISQKEQEEIKRAVKTLKTFKLKDIKDNVSDTISYFQIRLTLTKIKNEKKEGTYE